ncbi:MAG: VIT1/CCC1 transporter family protein [Patescibacteria group bacterium]|nr:MAG: VIT1/CCC1 transporter family protein [Patescibacteria group bacterium]
MEQHKKSRLNLRDVILGGQDGLVNVLGVTLGVAAASGDTRLVLVAGLAATFAESFSMLAVAYTSSLAERDYYRALLKREYESVKVRPREEEGEIRRIYQSLGFSGDLLEQVVARIKENPQAWVEEMMVHELQLTPKAFKDVLRTSFVVGGSAIVGSLIPLAPFVFLPISQGIWVSLLVSALTLFWTGIYKAKLTIGSLWRSGLEITVVGLLAALAGYLVGVAFK